MSVMDQAAPARSLQQRLDALEKGNRIRTKRKELKQDLKAGRRHIAGVLGEPADYLLDMKVSDLLVAVPKFGRVKVDRMLFLTRVSPSKTVGGLTDRQRGEIITYLAGRR